MQELGEISFPIWGTTATVLTADANRLSVVVTAIRAQLASFASVSRARCRDLREIPVLPAPAAGGW
jgi:hypothetical protein